MSVGISIAIKLTTPPLASIISLLLVVGVGSLTQHLDFLNLSKDNKNAPPENKSARVTSRLRLHLGLLA
jgi:hypothetical protein